jgi:SPP1 gp7 family putative phage head morphogenesis protein
VSNAAAQHTANLIRVHRAVGLVKRRQRIPRQIYPKLIEAEYAKRLLSIVDRSKKSLAPLERELPDILKSAKASRGDARMDSNEGRRAQLLIDQAREAMRKSVGVGEVETLAREFAHRTQTYQRVQLQRQTRAALGVDVLARDQHLNALTEHFVGENVSRIKTIPNHVHDDVESMVHRYVAGGGLHDDLADELQERFGTAESDARRIARDQIGKFYGQVNASRQRELGITRFIWRTVGDDRVRDEHDELEAQSEDEPFSYDDLPDEGLPGEPIQCRCHAEPVFDDVLAELDDDD